MTRPPLRLVLSLAMPALLQNWLVVSVSLSDRWLAARSGEADITATQAAQTTAAYLGWGLSTIPVLVTVGATTLTAHAIGAGRRREAQHVLHQAVLLSAGLAVAFVGFAAPLLGAALSLLGLEGETRRHAVEYVLPLLLVLPLQMAGAAGNACLIGTGDTKPGLFVLGGVAVINLPLAWFISRDLGLGFAGIGLGTAISQGLGGLAILALLGVGRSGLRLRRRDFRARPRLVSRLLRVSVPAAIDGFSMQLGYLWFLSLVNELGTTAQAAHGIALAWEGLGYHSGAGFGAAAIATVGLYRGAGDERGAARAGWTSFALGAALMATMGAVFYVLAGPMFDLFTPDEGQGEIKALGVPLLRLVAFGMPALASCMILAQALRGSGDTRTPMVLTWVGFFGVRIPLTYVLVGHSGLIGAWLAMFADMHVRGGLMAASFAAGRWRSVRV